MALTSEDWEEALRLIDTVEVVGIIVRLSACIIFFAISFNIALVLGLLTVRDRLHGNFQLIPY